MLHPSADLVLVLLFQVTQAEGFNKVKLFEILDTLLQGSDAILEKARAGLTVG